MTTETRLHTFQEKNNSVYALDIHPDASKFATAGKDASIRIYDESSKTCILKLKKGEGYGVNCTAGHSNRIFCVKYHPNEYNIVLSGGWDNNVIIWDTRSGRAERSLNGPHICGEAIDIQGNHIVTGSWRTKQPIDIWDFTSGRIIKSDFYSDPNEEVSMLYAAAFSRHGLKMIDEPEYMVTGGSGINEARLFHFNHCEQNIEIIDKPIAVDHAIYSVAFSPTDDKFVLAGENGLIHLFDILKFSGSKSLDIY